MMVGVDHAFFKSRTDYGVLVGGRLALSGNETMARGYLLGLEIAGGICRSHIISAAEKFGAKSSGVRIGRADLCCIEREIRRVKLSLAPTESEDAA